MLTHQSSSYNPLSLFAMLAMCGCTGNRDARAAVDESGTTPMGVVTDSKVQVRVTGAGIGAHQSLPVQVESFGLDRPSAAWAIVQVRSKTGHSIPTASPINFTLEEGDGKKWPIDVTRDSVRFLVAVLAGYAHRPHSLTLNARTPAGTLLGSAVFPALPKPRLLIADRGATHPREPTVDLDAQYLGGGSEAVPTQALNPFEAKVSHLRDVSEGGLIELRIRMHGAEGEQFALSGIRTSYENLRLGRRILPPDYGLVIYSAYSDSDLIELQIQRVALRPVHATVAFNGIRVVNRLGDPILVHAPNLAVEFSPGAHLVLGPQQQLTRRPTARVHRSPIVLIGTDALVHDLQVTETGPPPETAGVSVQLRPDDLERTQHITFKSLPPLATRAGVPVLEGLLDGPKLSVSGNIYTATETFVIRAKLHHSGAKGSWFNVPASKTGRREGFPVPDLEVPHPSQR